MPQNAVTSGTEAPAAGLSIKGPAAQPALAQLPISATAGALTDWRSLVNHQTFLAADTPLEATQKFFGSHDFEFVAVVENGCAIGLCARRQIGIVLGSRYGFSLFSRNPVRDYLVP
jgi:hypothetical protein